MSVPIYEHERIDRLIRENRAIIQSKHYFSFSVDAVLLANFIKLPKKRPFKYMDFCTGNGVVPIALSARTSQMLQGVEIQEELVEMARRSIQLNQLEQQIEIIHEDINQLGRPNQLYDIISCNPPYFLKENSKEIHHLTSHQLARHEVALTLDQWVKKASIMLKDKGRLFIVHRPERLDDLTETLLKHQFSLHRLQFAYPKAEANANIVLIEAIFRGGRQGVKIEPPIVIHNADNSYTSQMEEIYFG